MCFFCGLMEDWLDVDGILMVIFKWEYGDLMGYLWDIYIYMWFLMWF
jgi:hypothetical protein